MADLKKTTVHGKMTVKVLDTSTDANYLVIDETTKDKGLIHVTTDSASGSSEIGRASCRERV